MGHCAEFPCMFIDNQKRLRFGRILFVHHRLTNTRDKPVAGQFRQDNIIVVAGRRDDMLAGHQSFLSQGKE